MQPCWTMKCIGAACFLLYGSLAFGYTVVPVYRSAARFQFGAENKDILMHKIPFRPKHPVPVLARHGRRSEPDTRQASKVQRGIRLLRRLAGPLLTISLASTLVSLPVHAKAVKASKVATTAKETVPLLSTRLAKALVTFVAGGIGAIVLSNLLSPDDDSPCASKIESAFPRALKNKDLVNKVAHYLEKYDYGQESLLATALGPDEVNRVLERDFAQAYGDNYSLGGLAGFPFPGLTAFTTMVNHIPDGGSCLVVFGPHVGVDSNGNVGTVERRGRREAGPCCGSAILAAEALLNGENDDKSTKNDSTNETLDGQQKLVETLLAPYVSRLEKSDNRMVELPYVLYDAQKKMMGEIIKTGVSATPRTAKIAVLGGIQINTPSDTSDYFKPLSFEVYDNKGKLLEDLAPRL